MILIWFLRSVFSIFSSELLSYFGTRCPSDGVAVFVDCLHGSSSVTTSISALPLPFVTPVLLGLFSLTLPCCWGTNCFRLFLCCSAVQFALDVRSCDFGDLEKMLKVMILQQQKKPADNETNVWHFDVKREEKKRFLAKSTCQGNECGQCQCSLFLWHQDSGCGCCAERPRALQL